MFSRKDKEDEELEKILSQVKKEQDYDMVRTGYASWWLNILATMAEEGKITRQEVDSIFQSCNRPGRGGFDDLIG